MTPHETRPSVVLICHERDRLDMEGLASWLASTLQLSGLIVIRDGPGRLWRAARRELRRIGPLRFADVIAFRLYARLVLARRDAAWQTRELARLRERYPAHLSGVPRVRVATPNSNAVRDFLAAIRPDLVIARCKFILKPDIFRLARVGTFALHPGICPEYRNAHGCFWALVRRDLERVGMTLLKIDEGVDTGPVFLQAGCSFDEARESHTVIQHRVVFDNLEEIGRTLTAIATTARVEPVRTDGRQSATWGQPRLSDYLRWKAAARRSQRDAHRVAAVS
jgi:folate-dependent phosphoribosylglycinamide formyltransferase PurN